MAPVRPDRLKAILDAALRLDEPERTAYLEAMWQGDPALQTTIEQLLDASGPLEHFLLGFPSGVLDSVLDVTGPWAPANERIASEFAGSDVFEIVRPIASGGSGQVFEAFDRALGIRVALKVLPDIHAALVERFKRGWRAVGALAHRNLCRIYQFIHDPATGAWLLSMELIEGKPFTSYVRANPGRLRDAFCQLAMALDALHTANVCHGDVKPSNVLVTADGRVVVLDFGLSSRLDPDHAGDHLPVALTPKYAAPELLEGRRYTRESDWYSVGVMLRETLAALPGGGVEDLADLSGRLLHPAAESRPGAPEILRILTASSLPVGIVRESSPFVGREQEVRRIHELFRDCLSAGKLAVVHVCGVSGIGKTAFVEQTLRLLRQVTPGLTVLAGRCYQGESVPFKTIDEVASGLASAAEGLTASEARRVFPANAHLLSRLFPAFRGVLRDLAITAPADQEPAALHEFRRQAFDAFCELVSNLSLRSPLAIFIDDIQWGDLDSARLLKQLVESKAAPRLLLIMAYRSETGMPPNEGVELLREGAAYTTLTLGPLAAVQSVSLATILLGEQFETADAQAIAAEAMGSPFFLRQLAEHKKAGGDTALGRVIQERAASLAPLEQRSLEVLAIARAPLSLAVLRDAAGLGEQVRLIRSGLDSTRLIRSLGTPDEAVLPYHDRIAEAITGTIPQGRQEEIHHRIALALEENGNSDSERIAMHFFHAGAFEDACRLGRMAAQRAAVALAFERTAALYGKVLEWSAAGGRALSPADVAALEEARGDALSNCGRGEEAARAFQRALELAAPSQAHGLRLRAASELLRAGEIREGLDGLRKLLREHGLPFPQTRGWAIVRLLWERARLSMRLLRLRLFHIHREPAGPRALSMRATLEVCWAAATGISLVYPLLAEIYFAIYLRLALKQGEPRALALGWASYASRLAYVDDGKAARARKMMSRADRYAEADGSPYVRGVNAAMWATVEGLTGHWRRCLERVIEAESIFRTQCVGVHWELSTVTTYLFTARTILGEWTENIAGRAKFLDRARARGDRYAETVISLVSASYAQYLMDDQPDLAEAYIVERLAAWPKADGFDIQQSYAFQGLINVDLYRGNPRPAWDRIRATWPAIERSGLLRLTLVWTFLEDARARTAIALAGVSDEPERRRLLRDAKQSVRRLFRCKAPYAPGLAHLLAAGIACVEKNADGVRLHLLEAEASFAQNDLIPWLAITRMALSEYLPDPDQKHTLDAGMSWMNSQKIRRPECLKRMLFPPSSCSPL